MWVAWWRFSHSPLVKYSPILICKVLANIAKGAHYTFCSFVKFPCDQSNDYFMPIYLNRAITTVAGFLWCFGTHVTCLGFEHTLNFWFHYTYINIHIADILFSKPCHTQIQFISRRYRLTESFGLRGSTSTNRSCWQRLIEIKTCSVTWNIIIGLACMSTKQKWRFWKGGWAKH